MLQTASRNDMYMYFDSQHIDNLLFNKSQIYCV